MQRTGILVINSNVAQIGGLRLARNVAANQFGAAINFLANRGIGAGDFITVTGTEGSINSTPVLFITGASQGSSVVLGSAVKAASAGAAGAVKSTGRKAQKGGSKKSGSKKTKKAGSKKSGRKSGKKSSKKSASAKKAAGKRATGRKSGNK